MILIRKRKKKRKEGTKQRRSSRRLIESRVTWINEEMLGLIKVEEEGKKVMVMMMLMIAIGKDHA